MNNFFPIGELLDRLVIAELKAEKLGTNTKELDWYQDAVKSFDLESIQQELYELRKAHEAIWNLECLLKSGLENQVSLEEIGRRAIKIRNLNGERIIIKNTISKKLKCDVIEIKKDHISEY